MIKWPKKQALQIKWWECLNVGKVKNGCSEPYGVELRVTAYSKSGDVIDTATGWPFSVRNLEANSSEEFDMDQIFPYQKSMKIFAMQAVDTRHWK